MTYGCITFSRLFGKLGRFRLRGIQSVETAPAKVVRQHLGWLYIAEEQGPARLVIAVAEMVDAPSRHAKRAWICILYVLVWKWLEKWIIQWLYREEL